MDIYYYPISVTYQVDDSSHNVDAYCDNEHKKASINGILSFSVVFIH